MNEFSELYNSEYWPIFLGVMLFGLAIAILIGVLYLLNLQKVLLAVSPENRKMPPSNVWLNLIPLFNLVYQFFTVKYVAQSIEAELRSRAMPTPPMPTYNIGLAACILSLCNWIPFLGGLAGLAGAVCRIVHWVKTAEYKRLLRSLPPNPGTDSLIFNTAAGNTY